MFEKEAEEYIKEHTFFDEEYGVLSLDVTSKTIFKDGAKFGLKQHSHDYLVKTKNLKKKYEKENAELKEKLEKETAQRIYNLNKSIEWKEKHRGLEKENEQLKEQLLGSRTTKDVFKKQLAQAKKYLEECVYNVVSPERLRKDIEQFLKELAE